VHYSVKNQNHIYIGIYVDIVCVCGMMCRCVKKRVIGSGVCFVNSEKC